MPSPSQKNIVHKTPSLTPAQRRLFLLITLSIPLILFLFLEAGLRLGGYGSEFALVQKKIVAGKEFNTINPMVAKRYFDPAKYFVPQIYSGYFETVKSPTTFRVFIVGESTPAGFPYQYNAVPSRILQKQLEILHPDKNIEVINTGLTGTNSFTVLEFMDELTEYQPDVFIIYSGQNEFYGAFGAASTNSIGGSRWMIRLYQNLRRVRTFILVENTINAFSQLFSGSNPVAYNGTLMQQLAKDKAIPFNSETYHLALNSFEQNISEAVRIATRKNIPVILSTLVTNEGSLPPFVSVHGTSVNENQKNEITMLLADGEQKLRSGAFSEAVNLFRKITNIDPLWAMGQFRLGESYRLAGFPDSAAACFGKARDYDGLRFRASAETNTILRRIAASEKCSLADVESDFRSASKNGIIGSSLLWEHVHPNFGGYVLLSKTWLNSLEQSSSLASSNSGKIGQHIPDSLLVDRLKVTALDMEIGAVTMGGLLHRWPFTDGPATETEPTNDVQKVAQLFVKGKMRWNEAHYQMADLYRQKNDADNALNEYESVASFYPSDPYPLVKIGDLFTDVGAESEAQKVYLRSLTFQENSVVRLKIGVINLRSGSYPEAIDQLSKAMNGGNNSTVQLSPGQYEDAQFYFAAALYKSGNVNEAKTVLTTILQQHPDSDRAQRLSAEIEAHGHSK